jgi:Tfp pilus assembly protein PilN
MITLSIEDTHISATVFQGRTVKTAASTALEPGLVKDGLILNTAMVSQSIKDLFNSNGITEKQVIASITGIHSVYRLARLPKLKGSIMEEAVLHEMTRSMPLPLEQIYPCWQTSPAPANEVMVSMIALPRNTADALVTTLQQAGLSCSDLDLRPLAMARAAADPDALVINIQLTSFDIVIMADGLPRLVRSLPFANPGAPLDSKVNTLKEEVDRTIGYYNSEQKEKKISGTSNVYISGAFKEMLAEKMASAFNLVPMPQLLTYPENSNPDEWVINSGLALKQAKVNTSAMRATINVLPRVYQPKPFPVMQVAAYIFVIIALAIIAVQALATSQAVSTTEALQSKAGELDQIVKAAQAAQPEINKLQDQLKAIKTKRDSMLQMQNEIKSQRAELNDELAQITSLLPGTVIPGTITYSSSSKAWTVTGTTTGSAIIINYVSALQSGGKFSEVLISSMQEAEVRKWTFTLSLK